jgi:hypothetical protein
MLTLRWNWLRGRELVFNDIGHLNKTNSKDFLSLKELHVVTITHVTKHNPLNSSSSSSSSSNIQ